MTGYRLVAEPPTDLDVAAAFDWYENERAGLGLEFLGELHTTYDRIVEGPLKYQQLRSGIRRALVAVSGVQQVPGQDHQSQVLQQVRHTTFVKEEKRFRVQALACLAAT